MESGSKGSDELRRVNFKLPNDLGVVGNPADPKSIVVYRVGLGGSLSAKEFGTTDEVPMTVALRLEIEKDLLDRGLMLNRDYTVEKFKPSRDMPECSHDIPFDTPCEKCESLYQPKEC